HRTRRPRREDGEVTVRRGVGCRDVDNRRQCARRNSALSSDEEISCLAGGERSPTTTRIHNPGRRQRVKLVRRRKESATRSITVTVRKQLVGAKVTRLGQCETRDKNAGDKCSWD